MSPKFILREDMSIKIPGMINEIKLFDKGRLFEADEDGKYTIESMGNKSLLTEKEMREAADQNGNILFDVFEEEIIDQDLDIIVEEIPDDDENLSKKWRIQLDVTTTRKKLKEIEKMINENVKKIL
jgi:hypothetical protein